MEEKRNNPNYVQLMKTVVEHSESPLMEVAKAEWFITGHYKEEDGVTCLCGHPECKYVYIIANFNNNNLLAPIGSECMKHFEWDDQEKTILGAYEKWHFKKYRNPGLKHDQKEFNEVIKDVEYICNMQKYPSLFHSAEQRKLVCYATAVWVHNPPPPPPPPPPRAPPPPPTPILTSPPPMSVWPLPPCQKCVEQQKKGYKKCYECFTKKSSKPVCQKCEEQKKKGYLWCYDCYKKSQN